jgi:hypothetical protein
MNKDQQGNLTVLSVHLARRDTLSQKSAYAVVADATAIHAHARKLSRFAETECNREVTDKELKRAAHSEQVILKILKEYGLSALFSGDPRGYVVKIQGLPGNTWGGDSEGFGVG